MRVWKAIARTGKPTSKADNQMAHAKRRYEERFEDDLELEDYQLMISWIQARNENVKFLQMSGNRVSVWEIKWKDKLLIATYDKKRHKINTFMTPEMWYKKTAE